MARFFRTFKGKNPTSWRHESRVACMYVDCQSRLRGARAACDGCCCIDPRVFRFLHRPRWPVWCFVRRTCRRLSDALFFLTETMHTLPNTGFTRAALKAARPARRHVMRALRHHSARTRALAEQWRDAKPVDGIRRWFHSFFAALRVSSGSHRFSLRTLLRTPTTLRTLNARPAAVVRSTSRRPRRVSVTSTGWFAFATR